MTDTPEAVADPIAIMEAAISRAEVGQPEAKTARSIAIALDDAGLSVQPYTRPDADLVRQLVEALRAVNGRGLPDRYASDLELQVQVNEALTAARAAGYGGQS